ncbi:DNA cytosine methyltransferase [Pantoea agglomerans]|uniref:DNA cytosine methyltransferase n=1 Tax=Enterobacter agglomerans TaxID=549 RepID=UPI003D17D5F4
MTAYYNEFDPFAAQWLRNLIDAGHIAPGVVDDRSIADVTASDLTGFTQCHFFAGIGGWSYALRLAGIPDDFPCWTGSPPCQPFSVAGKQLGQLDERHLAPTFMRLVDQCRPPVLFGEQVAAAIGKHWLDDLFTELERQGYACGAAVLPAASVGAPHKRDRLFFGAALLEHASSLGRFKGGIGNNRAYDGQQPAAVGKSGSMADAYSKQFHGRGNFREGRRLESANCGYAGEFKPYSSWFGVCWHPDCRDSDRNYCDCDTRGAPDGWEWDSDEGWIRLGDASSARSQVGCGESGKVAISQGWEDAKRFSGLSSLSGVMAYGDHDRQYSGCRRGRSGQPSCSRNHTGRNGETDAASAHHSFWSDADWLGCRDGKFRPVESGSFPLVDGISNIMDDLRTLEISVINEIEHHANTCKTDTRQILSALRDALQQEASRQTQRFGMLFKLYAPEILLSFVLCISAACESRANGSCIKEANKQHCRELLRMLRLWGKFSSSPRRWESYEPSARELADPLFTLSLILARHVETYWLKTLQAHAASNRVGMLRGFGNAIVPQVAAEFVTAFMGCL